MSAIPYRIRVRGLVNSVVRYKIPRTPVYTTCAPREISDTLYIVLRAITLCVRVYVRRLTSTITTTALHTCTPQRLWSLQLQRPTVSCALHSLWALDSRTLRQALTRSNKPWTSGNRAITADPITGIRGSVLISVIMQGNN